MGCGGSKSTVTSPRRAPTGKSSQKGGGGGGKVDGQTQRKKSQAPVDEKGYKKRIRENLREATTGGEIEQLEKCMEIFVNNHLEDGGDFSDAQRRMEFLLIRKDIRDACMRRHPVVLEKAIQRVEASPYKRQLKPYLDRAYYLKQHQNELDTFRHDISDLEQATVSEIRSYNHPPPGVHQTMVAVYMILGYPEDHLLDWTEITALMGRYGANSLLREVAAADTKKIDNVTGLRARNYLGQYTLDEVRAGSNGAAAFYVWASRMVGKYESGKKGVDASPKKLTNSGAKGQPAPITPITNTKPAGPANDTKNAKQQQNTKQQQQTNNAKQTSAIFANNAKANKQEPPKTNTSSSGAKSQPAGKPGGQPTAPATKSKPADPGNDAKNAKQQQNTKQQQQTNNAKQTSANDANNAKAAKQEPPKANKQEPPKASKQEPPQANKQQPQTTDNTKTVSKQANGTSQVTPVKKNTKVKG